MQYQFVTQRLNYDCYASGKVFYSFPGLPAFPVRLASEIFLRCQSLAGPERRLTIYDPCCGSAYHLTTLGFLHPESIGTILASDISREVLTAAQRNLSLLSLAGMEQRIGELKQHVEAFAKDSHREALGCATAFKQQLTNTPVPIRTLAFAANATNRQDLQEHLEGIKIDLVFTDIPHGQMANWQGVNPAANPVEALLKTLSGFLRDDSLVAIASLKDERVQAEGFECLKQFKTGPRRVVILRRKPVI